MEDIEEDWNSNVLDAGAAFQDVINGPFGRAAQMDDADWALDWSASDNGHSRSGINDRAWALRRSTSDAQSDGDSWPDWATTSLLTSTKWLPYLRQGGGPRKYWLG